MKRLLIFFVISSAGFLSCGKKKPAPTGPSEVPVNLYTVASQPVLYYDQYPSTVQALNQVNIVSQVQGYVTNIYAKDGSDVKKGQVLYEIDRRIYQAAYEAAVANLRVAQGNQAQAQQDADRYVYLNNYHAVAKQLYDHAVIASENAKSQVQAAQESVNSAKANLGYSIITAPFSGTIGFSQVKLGNVVTVGGTVLNTISTNDPMAVDFVVNEKQLPHFENIQNGKERMPDSLFTILMPDNSLYPYQGKISVIDRAVDPQTGSIRIRLVFPNAKSELRAGMSCVVRVHNQDTQPQLVVPAKAVVEQMGEYFVYVAKDTIIHENSDSANAKNSAKTKAGNVDSSNIPRLVAVEKKVQTGQTIGADMVIKSGIQAGDKIVTDGVQTLHSGARITTANKVGPATGKGGGKGQ